LTVSTSTTYDLTAREVVTLALRRLGVLMATEDPSSEDAALGLMEMNVLLRTWQVSGPDLWRTSEGSLTLTADTASFSLPAAVYRVTSCRFRRSGIDLPMELLTREEYFDLPLKTSQGTPTQYYSDVQRSGVDLYVWPVLASVTDETIKYTYQRRFFTVETLDQTIDIPHEYLSAISWALAAALAPAFGKDDTKLLERSMMMLAQHQAADREPVIRFVPDRRR